ncbi:MAG: VOC family protein [Dehalococcoidia bacterium]|nr:VOC family protein [Dehalococcoidia bacterium]
MTVQNISAVTLAVKAMAKAVDFYQAKMGLVVRYGGPTSSFTSFEVGQSYLNLILATEGGWSWWGRLILHVADVDAIYNGVMSAGLSLEAPPEDASWGERYFHISDPDGHELSFAKRLGD